jgi:ABC-type dipeptide/oligopeptide/nickel transport system ATPase subunit
LPLLEVENLSKSYDSRRGSFGRESAAGADAGAALKGIDLTLERGGSLGIIGESGAGKTTLASLIVGLEKPGAGVVRLNGAVVGKEMDFPARAKTVQMVWQDAAGSFDPRLRLGSALAEPLRIHAAPGGRDRAAEAALVEDVMRDVGLDPGLARRYPHQVSGGELQRAAIARALILKPELLICDEPASALDMMLKRQIMELLLRLRRERRLSYIIIAHDISMVKGLTEEVAVLYRGSIVEAGLTSRVVSSPEHPYTRQLIASVPVLPVRKTPSG